MDLKHESSISTKQAQVIAALVEGNSIRATVRMTPVSKNAILRLLAALGPACEQYQNRVLRNLPCKRVQCDEVWLFCYAKQKNVPAEKQGQFGYGDVWTWTAICADTKLICSWQVGTRRASTAYALMHDLAGRMANRIQQLTTDGHRVYADAVESAFGSDIDYAMLVKMYGNDSGPLPLDELYLRPIRARIPSANPPRQLRSLCPPTNSW